MRGLEKNVFLIVPCYNEEKRLGKNLNTFIGSPFRFVFVDDGSKDLTKKILENGVKAPNYFISLPANSGKAEAVRKGVEFVRSLEEYGEADWIGFWDADMAAPLDEVAHMIDFVELSGGADAVYGSRVMRLGSVIKRKSLRHFLGRIFCTFVSMLFGIESYDTQCGAKLFNKAALEKAFAEPFLSRWIFDVEIILRLKGLKQIECPLNKWEDVKGSKISPFNSFAAVAADIIKIYSKYK